MAHIYTYGIIARFEVNSIRGQQYSIVSKIGTEKFLQTNLKGQNKYNHAQLLLIT